MIQANPNAPGCAAASSSAPGTFDQNNILVDKFISLNGIDVVEGTPIEELAVYAVNHLAQFTIGEKELYSYVLPFYGNSTGTGGVFYFDAVYFHHKKGK